MSRRINARKIIFSTLACLTLLVPFAAAQNFEVSAMVGGQVNGGLDLSTTFFHRLEVENGLSYGVTLGYLIGDHYSAEFLWNRNQANAIGEPRVSGPSPKLFTLTTNQYMGNFLYHFSDREHKMRPFVMFGLGGTNLSPDHSRIPSITRFAFMLGGGVKYNMTPHFGLRGQAKWSPTYITTNGGGVWCDPIWGGCWTVGNSHYLHEFDASGGITLRF